MKQKDFVKAYAAECGWNIAAAEAALEALAKVTSHALGEGQAVTLPGLIKIGTKTRAARVGRNPATGAPVEVPAKTVVVAKPVKALSDYVA